MTSQQKYLLAMLVLLTVFVLGVAALARADEYIYGLFDKEGHCLDLAHSDLTHQEDELMLAAPEGTTDVTVKVLESREECKAEKLNGQV